MLNKAILVLTLTTLLAGCEPAEVKYLPTGITELSDDNITQYIQSSDKYLIVQFSSYDDNCRPCIESNAYYDQLAENIPSNIEIARITWEPWHKAFKKSPDILNEYWIKFLPVQTFYKDGKEIWRGGGHEPRKVAEMNKLIKKYGK